MVNHVIATEYFILAITIKIIGVREMTGVVMIEIPQQVEILVINPKTGISVLDQNIAGFLVTRYIHYPDSIYIEFFKRMHLKFNATQGGGILCVRRNIHGFFYVSVPTVKYLNLKIHCSDDLVNSITIDIVDLVWKICCEFIYAIIIDRFANLPQDLSCIDADCRHATDKRISIFENTFLVLAHHKEEFLRTCKMPKSDLSAGSEILQINLFP